MLFYWLIINLLCVPAGIILVLVNAICREKSDGQIDMFADGKEELCKKNIQLSLLTWIVAR